LNILPKTGISGLRLTRIVKDRLQIQDDSKVGARLADMELCGGKSLS